MSIINLYIIDNKINLKMMSHFSGLESVIKIYNMLSNFFIKLLYTPFYKFYINVLVILFLLYSVNLIAEERILESINVTEEQNHSVIDIKFNQQLTVSSYTPLDGGDLLYIRVRPFGTNLDFQNDSELDETLPWKPSLKVPLYQVKVNLSNNEVRLHFNRSVKYKVRGGNNAFHLLIDVFHSAEAVTKLDQAETLPVDTEIEQHVVLGAEDPIMAKVMQDARSAMLEKDYARAIQLYTKVVLDGAKTRYAQEALEYLGLARERLGQLDHARDLYNRYLRLYPEGEDADRVLQRLIGVVSARAEPQEKLRKAKEKPEGESDFEWTTFGSVSQFYNRDVSKSNDDSTRLNRSALQNNLNVTSRLRSKDYQMTGRFSGSYDDNLETSDQDEHRISTFYLDVEDKFLNSSFRIGRQSRSTGGILGRFDGVLLSFPALESIQLNLVAGYSVESSRHVYLNNNTYFYGISADIGTYFDSLDFNAFFIEQINQGVLDRRAVGGEIRYFEPNRSFFAFLDYDIHHQELNTFIFTGQYVLPDRTTLNISYDQRKSPLLLTRNAINQTGVDTVDDLVDILGESRVLDLVRDRTSTTRSFRLGLSRPLTENLQINADFSWTRTSATNATTGLPGFLGNSGFIDAAEASGDDYSYSTDLTANSLITNGDLYTIGFRYRDSRANTTTFSINARYPVTQDLRINPRFRFDLRDNENGTTRWLYRPSVRITYRPLRAIQLEVEGGLEWQKEERLGSQRTAAFPGEFDRSKGYFIIVGYRIDF